MSDTLRLTVPGGGPMSVHVARPEGGRPRGAVIVLHELFGVNADIRSILDALAADGYLALAPEMFHCTAGPGEAFAKDDTGRAAAFAHLGGLTPDDVVDDIRAITDHLAHDGHRAEDVAILGFSAGGHMAVIAASALPVGLTIALYPGWLTATDGPMGGDPPTIDGVGDVAGRLVIALGGADHVVSPAERERIRRALANAGVDARMEVLDGVGHAFFWPGGPTYDAVARERAWNIVRSELAATADARTSAVG